MSDKHIKVVTFVNFFQYEDCEMTENNQSLGVFLLEPYRAKSKGAHITLPLKLGGQKKLKSKDILKLEYIGQCLIVTIYNDSSRKKSILFFLLLEELKLDIWQPNFRPKKISVSEFCEKEFRNNMSKVADTDLGKYFMVIMKSETCHATYNFFHSKMQEMQNGEDEVNKSFLTMYVNFIQEKGNMTPKKFKKLIYSNSDKFNQILSSSFATRTSIVGRFLTSHECGKKNCERTSYQKCSRCQTTRYCDEVCQRLDFPTHKSKCLCIEKERAAQTLGNKSVQNFLEDRLKLKLKLTLESFVSILIRRLYVDYALTHIQDVLDDCVRMAPRHLPKEEFKEYIWILGMHPKIESLYRVMAQKDAEALLFKESFKMYQKLETRKRQTGR